MTDQLQLPLTPLPPANQAVVEAYLLGMGFDYRVTREGHQLYTDVLAQNDAGKRTLLFIANTELPRITLLVENNAVVTDETAAETALFCNLMNNKFQVATLQFGAEDRRLQIRLTLAGDLGGNVDVESLETLVETAWWLDDRFFDRFRDVAEGRKKALEAFAEAFQEPEAR